MEYQLPAEPHPTPTILKLPFHHVINTQTGIKANNTYSDMTHAVLTSNEVMFVTKNLCVLNFHSTNLTC